MSEAERSLTTEDKLRIRKQSKAEASASCAETKSSQEEELVDRKGKGPDPSNWGQLDVHGDDLDINAQRVALVQWNNTRNTLEQTRNQSAKGDGEIPASSEPTIVSSKTPKKCSVQTRSRKQTRMNKDARSRSENPIENMISDALRAKRSEQCPSVVRVIEPAQQIAPDSYLGKALKQIGMRAKHRNKSTDSDDESDSNSDNLSPSESPSSSDPSDSLSSSETSSTSDRSSELEHRNKKKA